MDRRAMRLRCPRSAPVGIARLPDHEFFIAGGGFASIRHLPGSAVHGLLWTLDPDDEAALDDYEDLAQGLYHRDRRVVLTGAGAIDALVYLAVDTAPAPARPGYLEGVLTAARECGLPDSHLRELESWLPRVGPPS